MKNIILLVLAIFCMSLTSKKQMIREETTNKRMPWAVEPTMEYDKVWHFSDGLAKVMRDNQYGFIDANGKEIIQIMFTDAWSFSKGYARVSRKGKWGFINTSGEKITKLEYDAVELYSEDFAVVAKKNRKGDLKYGYINKEGKLITKIKYNKALNFSEGMARVKLGDKYGFINTKGEEVIKCSYNDTHPFFSEELVLVVKKGKMNFLDKKGKVKIELNGYESAGSVTQKLIPVKKNGKYGFVDIFKKEVVAIQYDEVGRFSNGMAYVKKDGKYGFVNTDGELITKIEYDEVEHKVEGRIVYIKDGERYDEVELYAEGMAWVKKEGKFGFVSHEGKAITPTKYDEVLPFKEELARVKKGNKYGFINLKGEECIPLKYTFVESFSDGLARVGRHNSVTTYFIDKNYKRVLENQPNLVSSVSNFKNGYTTAKKNGKWGILFNPLTHSLGVKLKWIGPNENHYFNEIYDLESEHSIECILEIESDRRLNIQNFHPYINGENIRKRRIGTEAKAGEPLRLKEQPRGKFIYEYRFIVDFEEYGKGYHEVGFKVKNKKRILGISEELTFNYGKRSKDEPVNLLILSVGPEMHNLLYTGDDAEAVYDMFNKKNKLFNKVKGKALTGKDATKANVEQALHDFVAEFKERKHASERDVVIIFFSSHGGTAHAPIQNQEDEYYINLYGFKETAASSTGITLQEIQNAFKDINCKKILLVDACYSGRAMSKGQTPTKTSQLNKAYQKVLKDLNHPDGGWTYIASSDSTQYSYECEADIQNGIFTEAMLQGLKNGKADTNDDGVVYLSELFDYLKDRIPELNNIQGCSGRPQHPVLARKDIDIPIYVVQGYGQ